MITTTVESNKRKASGKAFQDRHVKKIPKTFHLVRNVITVKTLNCRINLEICIQFQRSVSTVQLSIKSGTVNIIRL